jgi:hypothetical protein
MNNVIRAKNWEKGRPKPMPLTPEQLRNHIDNNNPKVLARNRQRHERDIERLLRAMPKREE